jgi:hypothetical protein
MLKCNEKGATQYYQRVTDLAAGVQRSKFEDGSADQTVTGFFSSLCMLSKMVEMTHSSPTAVLIIMW